MDFELGILDSVRLQAATPFVRADRSIKGWTCFYHIPFKIGLRFPILPLARQLLKYFDIALSQLMPNGWRILLALEILIERRNLNFSFENLFYTYQLKENDTDCGRYMIAPKCK